MTKYKYKNAFGGQVSISPNVGYDGEAIDLAKGESVEFDEMEFNGYAQSLSGFIQAGILVFVPAGKSTKKAASVTPSDVEGAANAATGNPKDKELTEEDKALVLKTNADIKQLQADWKVSTDQEQKKIIKDRITALKASIKSLK